MAFIWNGWTYFPSHGYLIRNLPGGGTRSMHRDVWERLHGPIPDGFEIHHLDGRRDNNEPVNLELVSRSEHLRRHPKSWHGSKAGREKLREIVALAYVRFTPKTKRCKWCRKEFLTRTIGHRDLYCSNVCKAAGRRFSGADNEPRQCVVCGGIFQANRFKKQKTCSRSCGNSQRARTMKHTGAD